MASERAGKKMKKKEPDRVLPDQARKSAITYFPTEQYHRRQGLNCCVRNGNRCHPLPLVTDNYLAGLSPGEATITLLRRVFLQTVQIANSREIFIE